MVRKKRSKQQSSALLNLKRQLLDAGLVEDADGALPGEPKLSASLMDLVAPFAPYAKTFPEYKALIAVGVAAWNLPLLKGPEHESFYAEVIQPLLESGAKNMSSEGHQLFNALLKRRQHDFADDKRFIVNFTVMDHGDEYSVAVAILRQKPPKNSLSNSNEIPE
jgi:hypothetical protein